MDEDSEINVPIKVRTHEIDQLQEMMPEVADRLEAIEHPDAEDFRSAYEEYVASLEAVYPGAPEDESFAAWASMPAESWRVLIRHTRRWEDSRQEWLQSKLMDRLEGRLEEAA
jgi:hypothetical protein